MTERPRYGIIGSMKWNKTTVPVAVEERHDLSTTLGKAFAMAYRIHGANSAETKDLLNIYKEARRDVKMNGSSRYGSYDAWYSTQ